MLNMLKLPVVLLSSISGLLESERCLTASMRGFLNSLEADRRFLSSKLLSIAEITIFTAEKSDVKLESDVNIRIRLTFLVLLSSYKTTGEIF